MVIEPVTAAGAAELAAAEELGAADELGAAVGAGAAEELLDAGAGAAVGEAHPTTIKANTSSASTTILFISSPLGFVRMFEIVLTEKFSLSRPPPLNRLIRCRMTKQLRRYDVPIGFYIHSGRRGKKSSYIRWGAFQ